MEKRNNRLIVSRIAKVLGVLVMGVVFLLALWYMLYTACEWTERERLECDGWSFENHIDTQGIEVAK